MTDPPTRHSRQGYVLLAVGWGLFTLYGSLVPFHYVPRPMADAVEAFRWVIGHRHDIESRSDFLANCLLGLPLGFCVVAALRVDRPGLGLMAAWVTLPACVLFSAGVEFLQLYFPSRTCSASDIIAQGSGSAVGVLLWVIGGQAATDAARRAWADPRAGGPAGQLLLLYAGFIVLVQLLPLDLTVSPAELYHKLRDGPTDGRVALVPFADARPAGVAKKVQDWLELAGLFLPAGLLLARVPQWRVSGAAALGIGLAAALATELGQVAVSRHPSTSDVVAGGLGVLAGWAAGRASPAVRLTLMGWWLVVLAYTHWQPFVFAATPARPSWVPFADAQAQNYFGALDHILERLVMYVPVGVFVGLMLPARGASGFPRDGPEVGESARSASGQRSVPAAALAGCALAALLEAGQLFLPARDAATTELVTGAAGAAAGAVAAARLSRQEARI